MLLLLILSGLSCSLKVRHYKSKINGISYGAIHQMGSSLTVAVNNIDTFSQNTLVTFFHCLESEASKSGREIDHFDVYTQYLYIDQLTPEKQFATVFFKPDTTMSHEKRSMKIRYLISNAEAVIDYYPHKLECLIE